MVRLTKSVRQRILDQNEGFTTSTSYESRNSREYRTYTITGGKLVIRATGKPPGQTAGTMMSGWLTSRKRADFSITTNAC